MPSIAAYFLSMKHLLAITITLFPSAVIAEQFTPQQMLDVMTKSPSNRDVRVHDATLSDVPLVRQLDKSSPRLFEPQPVTNR